MTIGIGGWASRRKPMSLVRAILRSTSRTSPSSATAAPTSGCCARRARSARRSTGSCRSTPSRSSRTSASPARAGTVEAMELDEGMLLLGLQAAAWRVPFLPTRAGLGTDMLEVMPELKTVRSPYPGPDGGEGEELLAMPALDARRGAHPHEPRRPGRQRPVPRPDLYMDDCSRMAAENDVHVAASRSSRPRTSRKHGSFHTQRISRLHDHRRGRGAGRRALHRVPAGLRPRRGVPEGVRAAGVVARGVGRVQARSSSTSNPRPTTSGSSGPRRR